MTFDKFIGEVQHRAQLPSQGYALRSVQAVLQTLGERLDPGESKDLAAQLPRELGTALQTFEHSVRMSMDEFFHRVPHARRFRAAPGSSVGGRNRGRARTAPARMGRTV
jgi:uncharacterized protein (DUF2267 family)